MIELSEGERIILLRRRNGLSQEQVADKYSVTKITVAMWENDTAPFPGIVNPLQRVERGEECYILRRRLGKTIPQAMEAMDVSHVTIITWEKQGCPTSRYKEWLLQETAKQEQEALA